MLFLIVFVSTSPAFPSCVVQLDEELLSPSSLLGAETGHLFPGHLSVAKCRRHSLRAHCSLTVWKEKKGMST